MRHRNSTTYEQYRKLDLTRTVDDNDVEDDDVSEATNTFRPAFCWCDDIRTHALGCGSGLEQVTVQELSSTNPYVIPNITVERLQKCVSDYAGQLEPGHYRLQPEVKVDRDGIRWGVSMAGLPDETSGFAGCTRIVLNEMAISREILNSGLSENSASTNDVTEAQRSYMVSPAVAAVVVVVGLSEIVLEAGAYTILFAVTVKVVEKAAEDVEEEGWRAVCIAKYVACTAASARKGGNHWGASRCATCLETCRQQQSWPSEIGNGSCEFWKRNWK